MKLSRLNSLKIWPVVLLVLILVVCVFSRVTLRDMLRRDFIEYQVIEAPQLATFLNVARSAAIENDGNVTAWKDESQDIIELTKPFVAPMIVYRGTIQSGDTAYSILRFSDFYRRIRGVFTIEDRADFRPAIAALERDGVNVVPFDKLQQRSELATLPTSTDVLQLGQGRPYIYKYQGDVYSFVRFPIDISGTGLELWLFVNLDDAVKEDARLIDIILLSVFTTSAYICLMFWALASEPASAIARNVKLGNFRNISWFAPIELKQLNSRLAKDARAITLRETQISTVPVAVLSCILEEGSFEAVIEYANMAAIKLFGYPDLIGMKLNVIVPEEFHIYHQNVDGKWDADLGRKVGMKAFGCPVHSMPSNVIGNTRSIKALRNPAGLGSDDKREIDVILGVEPIPSDRPGQLRFSGVLQDVTDLVTSQDELKETLDKLERALYDAQNQNLEVTTISRVVNHDLKSGMLVINAVLEEAQELLEDAEENEVEINPDLKDQLGSELQDGVDATMSLYALISGSSKLYNISHSIDIKKTPVTAIKEAAKPTFLSENVTWEGFDIDDTITLDLDLFVPHVLNNLISNGLKYNKASNKWVKVLYYQDMKYANFEITDNGIGIPESKHEDILNPSLIGKKVIVNDKFQADNPEDKSTGIGLYAAKKVIRAHKGALSIKSSEGVGTTFTIRLLRNYFMFN